MWTRTRVARLTRWKFHVYYNLLGSVRLMSRLGFTPQVPVSRLWPVQFGHDFCLSVHLVRWTLSQLEPAILAHRQQATLQAGRGNGW
ncbi:winged helix-turn-helix protein [Streptomyces sp. KS 21]|nr:winged helix-turn-helix protein [Streptomyces sp. KS 21]